MVQGPQPNEQILGDRLLKTVGIDPNKWTVGDRRIALLGIGIGLTIVIIAVCGYVFRWEWTGLAKQTFWDWLRLLIVPLVLALGGYLFTRSENRSTRVAAEQRAEDEALQAYLDQMGQMLLNKEMPLRQSKENGAERTLARAWTLTVLEVLEDASRRSSVVRFLYEAQLIGYRTHIGVRVVRVVSLDYANLSGCALSGHSLRGIDLSKANLSNVDLSYADLSYANLTDAKGWTMEQLTAARSLAGATMPDGQKYGDWLKARKGHETDGENPDSS